MLIFARARSRNLISTNFTCHWEPWLHHRLLPCTLSTEVDLGKNPLRKIPINMCGRWAPKGPAPYLENQTPNALGNPERSSTPRRPPSSTATSPLNRKMRVSRPERTLRTRSPTRERPNSLALTRLLLPEERARETKRKGGELVPPTLTL